MKSKEVKEQFYRAVLSLENEKECSDFFSDVCTEKEVETIAQRFAVARMLSDGKPYSEIVAATGASSATVSRVNRAMSKGLKRAVKKV